MYFFLSFLMLMPRRKLNVQLKLFQNENDSSISCSEKRKRANELNNLSFRKEATRFTTLEMHQFETETKVK